MPEIGPEHPVIYRQGLVAPLFAKIHAAESCAVIGAASMGKSRLLQFVLRPDVRAHYLADRSPTTLLIWADCNRMAHFSAWGLHELLLTGLLEAAVDHLLGSSQRDMLLQLRREVITRRNKLLAQRNVELALQLFCQELKLQLCFILDEFDEAYQRLSPRALASLRALRDRHKYAVSYLLFLRHHPAYLRPPAEVEGFYELFSRSLLGLHPHGENDCRRIIAQVNDRRHQELPTFTAATIQQVIDLSGGHPGLLVALLDEVANQTAEKRDWTAWARVQPKVQEECRKLWEGLLREERETLHHIACQVETDFRRRETLLLKGLIRQTEPGQITFFSPLFADYAARQAPVAQGGLRLDHQSGAVWLNGQPLTALTSREFDLLACLATEPGKIYETEEILAHLNPSDEHLSFDSSYVAALVRRLRNKIEPDPSAPQYLLNVRGRGYRLMMQAKEQAEE